MKATLNLSAVGGVLLVLATAPTNLEECLAAAQAAEGTITPQATRTCAFKFSQGGKDYQMGADGRFVEVAQVLNREGKYEPTTTTPNMEHLEVAI
jgi:hypothetical protein